jgi:cyclic-di-AMP phosphodiesterase PgpH
MANRSRKSDISTRKSLAQWLRTLQPKLWPSGEVCQQCSSKYQKKRTLLPLFLVATISLTAAAGYPFYNQPLLKEGAIATETIRAPRTEEVPDYLTTAAKRQAIQRGAIPVLRVDRSLSNEITKNQANLTDRIAGIRAIAGKFPFISTANLSTATQIYLRQAPVETWQEIIKVYNGSLSAISPNAKNRKAITELSTYRRSHTSQETASLVKLIETRRSSYQQAVAQISPPIRVTVLDLSDSDWQLTQTAIVQINQRILAQGIAPGLAPATLETAVSLNLHPVLSATAKEITTDLLLNTLKPNLVIDPVATQQQIERALDGIPLITIKINKGDKIVSRGELITKSEFVLLEHFGLSRRSVNWLGLIGFTGVVSMAVAIFIWVDKQIQNSDRTKPLRSRDYGLILLISLTTPILGRFGVYYTNLPAVGWLIGSFYHPVLATVVVSLLTGLIVGTLKVGWDYLLASAVAGILAAQWAGKMRSREELAFLGAGVVLAQGSSYFLLNLIGYRGGGSISYLFLDALRCSSPALGWSIFALGISPYLEHLFDLITPIRLVELANPNRPLLKRLAAETPGTFQHTMFVSNLAEAAAKKIGLNVELVRTGTLYHDIGKMHDPMGFIENQMDGVNKHDLIDNPWESAQIIKKHVTEGLVMARRYRLPKAIQAFIPEHQGTIPIAYFHHQAQQLAAANPSIVVSEADFRYGGPIPQSRETGIVMLADACEAALRSLKDISPDTALITIKKILHARWQEGQLADSGLTKEHLSEIANTFLEVWRQSNHQRIVYPPAPK